VKYPPHLRSRLALEPIKRINYLQKIKFFISFAGAAQTIKDRQKATVPPSPTKRIQQVLTHTEFKWPNEARLHSPA